MSDSKTPDRDFLNGLASRLSTDGITNAVDIERLRELALRMNVAICSWCGRTDDMGDDMGARMLDHVAECEKHPLRKMAQFCEIVLTKLVYGDMKAFELIDGALANIVTVDNEIIDRIRKLVWQRLAAYEDFKQLHPQSPEKTGE